MLLIIAAIENPTDRELMSDFYKKSVQLLLYEAKKHSSTHEDAEDAVQEAFRRLIEKIDTFRRIDAAKRARYAVVTVRNVCYMQLRKKKRQEFVSFENLTEEIPGPETDDPAVIVEHNQYAQQLRNVLRALDLEDWMLLEQKYILHWTDAEMAVLYEIKPDSMRMKIARARRNLMNEMEIQGFKFADPFQ